MPKTQRLILIFFFQIPAADSAVAEPTYVLPAALIKKPRYGLHRKQNQKFHFTIQKTQRKFPLDNPANIALEDSRHQIYSIKSANDGNPAVAIIILTC